MIKCSVEKKKKQVHHEQLILVIIRRKRTEYYAVRSHRLWLIESFSNDDGDGNENVTKQ